MEYKIEIPKRVQKELEKLPRRYQEVIVTKLRVLTNNPFLGKRLQGEFEGLYSLRAWPYRIIYEVRQRQLIILLLKVAHRKDAYT
ncbi:MAG: type II toxin-antitoxin system RelE/ParE family toxin [Candidatus Doudnabacteria bacterium]|nr:type II toxin-antitoxin system RelE/ParE family toxin [Candidatus Doudnabacteria bacterium]